MRQPATASRSLIVHGGPGGGCNATMRRFHDPGALSHRPVRPARLRPLDAARQSLEANTTWDLVADMERLRTHLGIERWQLFGGSWGSTLALAYAETHPERVSELVLRGIFLLRREELDWFYQERLQLAVPGGVGGVPQAHPARTSAAT